MNPPTQMIARLFQWLVMAGVVGYFFGWFGPGEELSLSRQLRESGSKTIGRITSVTNGDSLNSPSAYYSYSVEGQSYDDYSHIGPVLTSQLGPGTSVDVIYLPADPSRSGIDLDGMAASGRRGIMIAAILETVLAAIFIPLILRGGSARPFRAARASISAAPGNVVAGFVVLSVMVVAGLCMLAFSAIPAFCQANALVESGRTINAQITGVWDHDKGGRYAQYTFQLQGRNYHGETDYQGGYGDRGPIGIYYLPDDPTVSAGDPSAKLARARSGLIFAAIWNCLVLAIVAVLISRVRRQRR